METRTIESRVSVVGARKLQGYAVKYNSVSTHQIASGVKEVFLPRSFARTLGTKADVRFLYEHKSENLLGRTSSGTLQLRDDDEGLGFTLDLPSTQLGMDLLELCKRGDIKGMSFGFVATDDDFSKFDDEDDYDDENDRASILRTVRGANLVEISAVATPVYESSSVLPRAHVDPRVEARAQEYARANRTPEQIDAINLMRLQVIKASL